LIEVKNASFSYGKEPVFGGINLRIKRGEIFCLLGPNGCGKSTLLQCLLGILRLNSGAVTLDGRNVADMRPWEIARKLAYIPQLHEKPFPFKVIDVVLMGRVSYTGLFALPTEEDREIALAALEQTGMSKYREKPYTQLSGGETQLVMVARALAQQTPVLVMDEPTTHLDFHNELHFLETVVRLVGESGMTVIMATHFPNHCFYFENNRIKTKVALMNDRVVAGLGSPSAVLTERQMWETFGIVSKVLCCEWEKGESSYIVPLKTL
jgi:iron complex transport system ATP-binding protein